MDRYLQMTWQFPTNTQSPGSYICNNGNGASQPSPNGMAGAGSRVVRSSLPSTAKWAGRQAARQPTILV